MKAAMCTTCGQVVGPRPRQADWSVWTWCADPCAHSAVRWRDGNKGLLEVTSLHGPDGVVVIGLHNGFFAALADRPSDKEWERVHDAVTDAPGYLFDKSRRNCWAVLTRVGQSGDVFFVGYGEAWATRPIPPAVCACGHPGDDHDDGACMHLCDCAWSIPPAETGGSDA